MSDLQNVCVLVTRPGLPGKELCEKITALGGVAFSLPTIDFAPVTNSIPSLDQYQWVIFVSQPAVWWARYALPTLQNELTKCRVDKAQRVHQKIKVASPGKSTAQALAIDHVIYPAQNWTSEGLLDLPDFQNIANQKILLVRGEGGREWLADTLKARGGLVDHWIVYRRLMPVYSDKSRYLDLLRQKKIDIVVCASGESLHNLLTMIGQEGEQALLQVPLIVVSQRLSALAKELKFQHVFVASNASHAAILDSIKSMPL